MKESLSLSIKQQWEGQEVCSGRLKKCVTVHAGLTVIKMFFLFGGDSKSTVKGESGRLMSERLCV